MEKGEDRDVVHMPEIVAEGTLYQTFVWMYKSNIPHISLCVLGRQQCR